MGETICKTLWLEDDEIERIALLSHEIPRASIDFLIKAVKGDCGYWEMYSESDCLTFNELLEKIWEERREELEKNIVVKKDIN